MHRTLDEFINHPTHTTDSHHHSLTASHSVGFSRSHLSPRGARFPHPHVHSKAHDRLGLSSKPSVLGNGYALDVEDDLGYGDERRRRTNGIGAVPVRFGSSDLQSEVELKEMDEEEDMEFTKLEELEKNDRDARRQGELERALDMDVEGRGSDIGRRDEESRQATPTWRRD